MAKKSKKTTVTRKTNRDIQLVPSGVTILDLACSDTLDGFCLTGTATNMIGKRSAGKTLLALASMAETFYRYGDQFGYKLVDAENAYSFDTAHLFGQPFADALEIIPVPLEIEWCTEMLKYKFEEWMREKPQMFALDSVDALVPRQMYERKERIEEGKQDFHPAPKANTELFNYVVPLVGETKSVFMYMSQGRDGMGSFASSYRRGGAALGFHAHTELWLTSLAQIKKTVAGNEFSVGHHTRIRIGRSKINGKRHTVEFPILYAYGIDNTTANIEWLAKRKAITCVRKVYDLSGIGIDYEGKDPSSFIENNNLCDQLIEAVRDKWQADEAELVSRTLGERKGRYE